jgi:hypothetical protein
MKRILIAAWMLVATQAHAGRWDEDTPGLLTLSPETVEILVYTILIGGALWYVGALVFNIISGVRDYGWRAFYAPTRLKREIEQQREREREQWRQRELERLRSALGIEKGKRHIAPNDLITAHLMLADHHADLANDDDQPFDLSEREYHNDLARRFSQEALRLENNGPRHLFRVG